MKPFPRLTHAALPCLGSGAGPGEMSRWVPSASSGLVPATCGGHGSHPLWKMQWSAVGPAPGACQTCPHSSEEAGGVESVAACKGALHGHRVFIKGSWARPVGISKVKREPVAQ